MLSQTSLDCGAGRLLDTYATTAEADQDKTQQQHLLAALNGWERALQRDGLVAARRRCSPTMAKAPPGAAARTRLAEMAGRRP
jgi:hypothetical protein